MSQGRPGQRAREDEQVVSAFMTALADTQSEESRIPPAGQIWWRAQLSRRQAVAEKAMRPLVITEATAVAMVALGGAAWLAVRGIPSVPTPILAGLVLLFAGLSAAVVAVTVRSLIARD